MDFLIVGHGMFGAAIARHLAPHATVTVVGPGARADGSGAYGAHHDEGRIIGDLSRDVVWSELKRRARGGMTGLDPTLITPCGALSATTRDGADYLTVGARIRERQNADIQTLTAGAARADFPMARFGPDETILHQPTAGHFSPRRYVALALQSAQRHGVTITSGTVQILHTSTTGMEAELDDGRRLRAEAPTASRTVIPAQLSSIAKKPPRPVAVCRTALVASSVAHRATSSRSG